MTLSCASSRLVFGRSLRLFNGRSTTHLILSLKNQKSLLIIIRAVLPFTVSRDYNKMRVSSRLLQSCRITLFTRENCGLCTQAKSVLTQVRATRPFELKEVDIANPGAKRWKDLYDFDVPVVSLFRKPPYQSQRFRGSFSNKTARFTSVKPMAQKKIQN